MITKKLTRSQQRVYDAIIAINKNLPGMAVSQKQMAEQMGIVGQLHKTSPRCKEMVDDGWLLIKGKVNGDNGYVINYNRNKSTLEKAMMLLDEKKQVYYYGGANF